MDIKWTVKTTIKIYTVGELFWKDVVILAKKVNKDSYKLTPLFHLLQFFLTPCIGQVQKLWSDMISPIKLALFYTVYLLPFYPFFPTFSLSSYIESFFNSVNLFWWWNDYWQREHIHWLKRSTFCGLIHFPKMCWQ